MIDDKPVIEETSELVLVTNDAINESFILERYLSYNKMIRIFAFGLRFISHVERKKLYLGELSFDEILESETSD